MITKKLKVISQYFLIKIEVFIIFHYELNQICLLCHIFLFFIDKIMKGMFSMIPNKPLTQLIIQKPLLLYLMF